MTDHGSWVIDAVDGADVRLRSGRIGLFSVDVKAPVRSGTLVAGPTGVRLDLVLALNKLSTGNFLMDRAAKSLISRHDASDLNYTGHGEASEHPWQISGHAVSGDVNIELTLSITPIGGGDPMAEIELRGSASMGTVHLPLPGLGTVDDFAFDVDARLALTRT